MRIIAGDFGGRKLSVPNGGVTRPTTDRVKEASFNLLFSRFDISGATVLDLYAGTGSLGLEALSRGAGHVTFVESDPRALQSCRKNVKTLEVEEQCSILQMDASVFLNRAGTGSFELILIDPPYKMEGLDALANKALRILAPHGLLVIEHDRHHDFSTRESLVVSRRYGRTSVSLFSNEASDG